MSYDISITKTKMKKVTETIFEVNYTYNVSPMFRKALGEDGINQFHNKKAGDCIATLEKGIKEMENNWREYIKLNPENGWGDCDGALKVLKDLLTNCKKNRNGLVTIS